MDTREEPILETAEEMVRNLREQRRLNDSELAKAQMLPLRRALAIPENDVNAPVDLNDDIVDCARSPSCALTFQDLNDLRQSEFRVTRAWVPGWLWALGERVPPVRALLTKKTHGDLVGKGIGGGF